MSELQVLEGTWEEVASYAPQLAGKKVRLTVLPSDSRTAVSERPPVPRRQPTRYFETDEPSAPFSPPRIEAGPLVDAVPGGRRLPDASYCPTDAE